MKSNLSVYRISDTLLKEIKGAVKGITGSDSLERSVKKGLVRKISGTKKTRRRN
jgi:hypothetical protein